jgi:glycosyltransferase involved in cell wall biosynthesis
MNAVTFMVSLVLFLWRQASSFEVIHVHLAGSPALAATLVGRLLKKRVIVKIGGGRGIGEFAVSSRTLRGRLKLWFLSRAKPQFVAVAKELARESKEFLGDVPVEILPNGVDVEIYHPASAERKRICRASLGWPENGLGFLYVGRLSPEKCLPQFVEVWSGLAKKARIPAFVAIVGNGIEEVPIQEAAERRGAGEQIFLHPSISEITTAYAAADVFVLPSLSEGLSNALLEAMASGLGVLASRVGGTVEAVEMGKSGLLFDPDNTDELKRCIQAFLDSPELVEALGQEARERVLAHYSLSAVAWRYEVLYQSGLG